MRSILMITPFFAPQSHAAVFRAHKLAKYLPSLGWKVTVLTTDTNYHFFEDAALLSELPGVDIIRARYVEPTLRGLRMAMGGVDRTTTRLAASKTSVQVIQKSPRPSLARRLYGEILERWAQVPDAYWTWRIAAYREAVRVIREKNIPIVMTSSSPYSTLELGLALQKNLGIKWLADFRDVPLTYDHRQFSSYPQVLKKQKAIEKEAFEKADLITMANSAGPLIAADMLGPEKADKIHFIPTGADEALFPSGAPEPGAPYLVFTGEYLKMYGEDFLKIFSRALEHPGVKEAQFRVRIIGRVDVNRAVLSPLLEKYGLASYFDFVGHMSQRELYREIQGARAGLLTLSRTNGWWILSAKLVDFLALQKPVLARVPDPSEARKWLTRSKLGIFLDGEWDEAADQLAAFIVAAPSSGSMADQKVCGQFTATQQAEAFSKLFRSLLSSVGSGRAESVPR